MEKYLPNSVFLTPYLLILAIIVLVCVFWGNLVLLWDKITHYWHILKNTNIFQAVYKWLKTNTLGIFVTISIILIAGYGGNKYWLKLPNIQQTYWEDLYKLGLAMLSSGVFLAVLKYFQFQEFFQKAIKEVIYSEDYLKTQSNIYDIWKLTTRSLLSSELPKPVVEKAITAIFDKFLKEKTLSHYYQNVDIRYTISLDGNYVKLTEWIHFKIKNPDKDTFSFDVDYSLVKINNETTDVSIQMNMLKIGNEIEKNTDAIWNEGELKYKFEKELKNTEECTILQQFSFSQHIDTERDFWYNAKRIVDNITITITNSTPKALGIVFVEKGISTFSNDYSNGIEIHKSELLLPNNGFRFIFYKK